MKLRTISCVLLSALLISACATVVADAPLYPLADHGFTETRNVMGLALTQTMSDWSPKRKFKLVQAQIQSDRLIVLAQEQKGSVLEPLQRCEFLYSEQTAAGIVTDQTYYYAFPLKSNCPDLLPIWSGTEAGKFHAVRFLSGLRRLQQLGPGAEAEEKKKKEEFKAMLAEYRGKPAAPLPEEARRHKVQAEASFEEKRYALAADSYRKALELAPWWADGRYNRALILAELQQFAQAIEEMEIFLELAPQSPDARKAQDIIYVWEPKASAQKQNAAQHQPVNMPGAACFVATAAYGDADHPDVRYLRQFRDTRLMSSRYGRSFVDWYWRAGPKAANLVETYPMLRAPSRALISTTVKALRAYYAD